MTAEASEIKTGNGYAVGHIDAMGEGFGFRKLRRALGVTAFGANVIVIPPRYRAGKHYHESQEEMYFIHRGTVEMEFGAGEVHQMGPGSVARVDPSTVREVRNASDEEAVYLVVGGKDGYVGRDGLIPDDEDPEASQRGAPLD
jgi:uncharacterized cupin superfamily protein